MSNRKHKFPTRKTVWTSVNLPNGAQLIKTVKDWGDGRCTEQTKICKNLVVETVLFYMKADQRIAELTVAGYEIIK
jgi:hypothetical protein